MGEAKLATDNCTCGIANCVRALDARTFYGIRTHVGLLLGKHEARNSALLRRLS